MDKSNGAKRFTLLRLKGGSKERASGAKRGREICPLFQRNENGRFPTESEANLNYDSLIEMKYNKG